MRGQRSVEAGWRKEMTDGPSTSFKKFRIDLNIRKLLNCGSLKKSELLHIHLDKKTNHAGCCHAAKIREQ